MFRVRPQLNDFLRTVTGGHIGYGIIKKARGKGYATKGLALALKELKKRTEDKEAYLFCHKDNPASLHVMQKNGAYIHHETEENICTRIKLQIKNKKGFSELTEKPYLVAIGFEPMTYGI